MQPGPAPTWTVVTGASAGMGKALVERIARDGRNVIAMARDPARVNIPNGPGRVEAVRLDFDNPRSVEAAYRDIPTIVGTTRLTGLVNMAGIIVEGPLEAVTPQAIRRQFEVNVIGPVALTQALLPLIAKARGTVVNIGAISARLTPPFYGPIAASKAALASFNDAMRQEFAPLGVNVVLIEPAAMRTGIFATSRGARDEWLAQRPDVERRYRPAIAAMERAFEKSGADDPEVVVSAVIAALSRRRSKPRVVVGKGAGALVMMSRLPIRLRDRLMRSALGLSEALKPAG